MRERSSSVLVTGGTGFVGSALARRLASEGRAVRITSRHSAAVPAPGIEVVHGLALAADTRWQAALAGVDCVVHAAARVHVMHDTATSPLEAFRRINVDGTLALARQAADAGVRRFVFMSSIKVNGESTEPGRRFRADDVPNPIDPYGISKREGELALQRLAADSGLEVVVIRPPLVYGPGVKANFRTLLRWVARGVPLPLGAIDNARSMVALDNLVDLIVACIDRPEAAGATFLVSDDEDLSTPELLRRCGRALQRPARLVPVPAGWLRGAARLAGRPELALRLCGSLQVDIGPTRERLGWRPPTSVDAALADTAGHFLRSLADKA